MVNRTKKEPQKPLVHTVLIAESCPLFRSAIKHLLEQVVRHVDITETGTAQEALHAVRRQSFDLAILDISLPDRNGTDLVKELKQAGSNLRILVLTMLPEAQYAVRVFQSGGNGYLNKNAPPEEVAHAIKTILDGKEYVSKTAAQHLALEVKSTFVKFPHETLSSR
ncbi:MAG TPA: response regulator transcription factor [Nitrospira sp.]|nr:response regulator transcription factor [Nitrospira sp.]